MLRVVDDENQDYVENFFGFLEDKGAVVVMFGFCVLLVVLVSIGAG